MRGACQSDKQSTAKIFVNSRRHGVSMFGNDRDLWLNYLFRMDIMAQSHLVLSISPQIQQIE